MTFEELGIESKIIKAIKELGFENPMPVQEKVIPHLMQEKFCDVVALAQTGTGKTAAFGLPLIQRTDFDKKFVQHLILCPTRELCLQISNDLDSFAKYKREIKIAEVYGGASIQEQIRKIKKGVQIISATPGRLLDLLEKKVVDISKIKTVVLDEADEMLNMGFKEELETILSKTPFSKNTLLFSATMPNEIMLIANRYMKNKIEITIGKRNSGAENVEHVCYMVHAKDRYASLKRIADFYPDIYGIIFCRTRYETKEIADKLLMDGYNTEALHGDLSQAQRDAVMNKFRLKHLNLLVATDVAARGIDVDSLTHIINYDLPDELKIYTHRSGRTGRAGKTGVSIVIANLKEKNKLQSIEKKIGKKFKYLPVPLGEEICEKQLFNLIDRMQNVELNDKHIESYLPEIYKKLESLKREEIIKRFVSLEFNRFLNYYKNTPDLTPQNIFSPSNKDNSNQQNYTRFFINLGNKDNLKPTDIIGMVKDFTGVRNIDIGNIEILKTFSFFEVEKEHSNNVVVSFNGKEFRKRRVSVEIAEGKKKDNRNSKGKKHNIKERNNGFDRPKKKKHH